MPTHEQGYEGGEQHANSGGHSTGSDTGNESWREMARCSTGTGAMLELFFSEELDDIDRAKAFCRGCEVRTNCLDSAIERAEPWGVWGGELLIHGHVYQQRRKRGRPPKNPVQNEP